MGMDQRPTDHSVRALYGTIHPNLARGDLMTNLRTQCSVPGVCDYGQSLTIRWAAIVMLVACVALWGVSQAFAQTTITVTDTTQIASDCTLTNAIESANLGIASGKCKLQGHGTPYTIQLQANQTYTMATVNNWWYGPNALPPIATTIVIQGNGATLQVTDSSIVRLRFFFVAAYSRSAATMNWNSPGVGNLTLQNLTLTGGRQQGGDSLYGGGGAGLGGAIYNQGTLSLNQVTISGNSATGGSIAEACVTGTSQCIYSGGGMGSEGVDDSVAGGFGGNVTPAGSKGGAGGSGTNLVTGGGGGGGIKTSDNGYSPVTTFSAGAGGGSADGLGGAGGGETGVASGGAGGDSSGGGGEGSGTIGAYGGAGGNFGHGGAYGETQAGDASGGGGGVGGGGGFAGGGGGFGGGGGSGTGDAYIGGGGGGFGGGGGQGFLYPGSAGFGAGAGSHGGGGSGDGGGGGAGLGGAIFNHNGSVVVTNSTLGGNSAVGGSNILDGNAGSGYGGAIFNLNGTVSVSFSTIAGNTADEGGAIYNLGYNLNSGIAASLILDNSILANSVNASATAVDDLVNNQPSTVASGANNAATAAVTYQNFDIVTVSNNSGGTVNNPTAVITTNPDLGALTLNAPGATATMAITNASPAFDVIPIANCTDSSGNVVTVDQRGVTRPQVNDRCDIGAYELIAPVTVSVTVGTSLSGLAFSVDGTSYSSTQSFTWDVGSQHTIATTSPQYPSAGTQETFASWSDGGALSHSVTAAAGTTSYTANFIPSFQLTTAASPTNGGTVTPPSGTYYPVLSVVDVTATANTGYVFLNWTGFVTNSNSAATTVRMIGPASVTANFVLLTQMSLSPTSLSFGNQVINTTSSVKTVTVKNTGSATLYLSSIAPTAGFSISSTTCGATLAVGKTCEVKVTFTPSGVGAVKGVLSFSDNASGSPQSEVLSGTGVEPATLSPVSATYAKQKVGTTSAAKTFTLTNNQAAALTSIAISTTGDFAVSTNTCGTTLAAKGKCTITVVFEPAQTGTLTGQLTISDSAGNSPQTSTLTGTGD
jgi:hypothetical protein